MRIAIIAALALAGCQTTQPGIVVKEVRVPVPVECLPAEQIPAEPPLVADDLTGNAAADLPIVAASAILLRSWGQTMHGALTACAPSP